MRRSLVIVAVLAMTGCSSRVGDIATISRTATFWPDSIVENDEVITGEKLLDRFYAQMPKPSSIDLYQKHAQILDAGDRVRVVSRGVSAGGKAYYTVVVIEDVGPFANSMDGERGLIETRQLR